MPIIYWFRNDLRLHDNEGFSQAVADSSDVLPVFIIDPRSFDEHPDLGFRKAGVFRVRFLFEALADLRERLRGRGGDLLIRVGNVADVLADLAQAYKATAVYAGKEITHDDVAMEAEVDQKMTSLNVPVHYFWMLSLYHPDDLPFAADAIPDAYRDFRRGCERESGVRPEVAEPERVTLPGGVDPGPLPTLTQFGYDDTRQDERAAIRHVGGETAALNRLAAYFWERDQLRNYKFTRNNVLGEDYSSKFSAWLAYGCLSPRRVYWQVKQYEKERVKNVSTYWLVFELIWRDYFRFITAKYGARIFFPSGPRRVQTAHWNRNKELFWQWANGQTGVPFVDANMRELNLTGYQSNRGRQNVASLLLNDLGVLWTWGAAYLESLLIDYDPCSNWGNWNLVAKVSADPRMDRYFNIYTQGRKYDPKGEYVSRWLPELANIPPEHLHLISLADPAILAEAGVTLGETYPQALVDMSKWTRKKKVKK
ncbi:DASH family cryptochrome [Fibrella sp. HMF5335]|uniref:Cryptochrome DASH n=1 Tax=Fibrella rubiginis TaxID=2817060 RepID=A0A939K3A3_9BACT|nr:DASH family cryptochrome [Fibrella rubiginis]MBO0937164.1 DASH family cryptochrome [Fibrella rubiginis]